MGIKAPLEELDGALLVPSATAEYNSYQQKHGRSSKPQQAFMSVVFAILYSNGQYLMAVVFGIVVRRGITLANLARQRPVQKFIFEFQANHFLGKKPNSP